MTRKERERSVLFGVVELYLRTGKPVGSQTLQESGFPELSSATIRNYFAELETDGYLQQHHTSGGRTPLSKAFRLYAQNCLEIAQNQRRVMISDDRFIASKEVVLFLQESAEEISHHLNTAVFLSLPRFDRDNLAGIKYVPLERNQMLVIFVTTFGTLHTELISIPRVVSLEEVQLLESFSRVCLARTQGGEHDILESMTFEEREFARIIHQEVMARFLVAYSSVSEEDLYRTGFSRLLSYTDVKQPTILDASVTSSLVLFENRAMLRGFCRDAVRAENLRFWIGDELDPYTTYGASCALVTAPYRVSGNYVGAFGVIGPIRMFYKELFEYLLNMCEKVSRQLTKSLCTFQIGYQNAGSVEVRDRAQISYTIRPSESR